MENILQVELNNSIRKTSKFLSRIEVTIIEFFKEYEVSNIIYSFNPDMSGKYLDIEFRTEANRVLQLQIAEREKDGIFIWPPYILRSKLRMFLYFGFISILSIDISSKSYTEEINVHSRQVVKWVTCHTIAEEEYLITE